MSKHIHRKPRAEETPEDLRRSDSTDGAAIEHFRGERPSKGTTGDEGDLDQETLDADAPYNKTYGRTAEETSRR